jgi:hypothetical protein
MSRTKSDANKSESRISAYAGKQNNPTIAEAISEVLGTEKAPSLDVRTGDDVLALQDLANIQISVKNADSDRAAQLYAKQQLAMLGVGSEEEALILSEKMNNPPKKLEIAEEKEIFVCEVCHKSFRSAKTLEKHQGNCPPKRHAKLGSEPQHVEEVHTGGLEAELLEIEAASQKLAADSAAIIESLPVHENQVKIDADPLKGGANLLKDLILIRAKAQTEIDALSKEAITWWNAEYLPALKKAETARGLLVQIQEALDMVAAITKVKTAPVDDAVVAAHKAALQTIIDNQELEMLDERYARAIEWHLVEKPASKPLPVAARLVPNNHIPNEELYKEFMNGNMMKDGRSLFKSIVMFSLKPIKLGKSAQEVFESTRAALRRDWAACGLIVTSDNDPLLTTATKVVIDGAHKVLSSGK